MNLLEGNNIKKFWSEDIHVFLRRSTRSSRNYFFSTDVGVDIWTCRTAGSNVTGNVIAANAVYKTLYTDSTLNTRVGRGEPPPGITPRSMAKKRTPIRPTSALAMSMWIPRGLLHHALGQLLGGRVVDSLACVGIDRLGTRCFQTLFPRARRCLRRSTTQTVRRGGRRGNPGPRLDPT